MFKTSYSFPITFKLWGKLRQAFERRALFWIALALCTISVVAFWYYYQNGLGLAYNDARSHLNIGRRVVEGLQPGAAQLGSVWLPLTHLLMVPTVWNDFMWHSGLSGAIQSMVSFVATGLLIYLYLRKLDVGMFGRLVGVAVFVLNLNVLYLQSTAMTELLLLATMSAGAYYFLLWFKDNNIVDLIKSSFWIMLSTLIRYDGWFLLAFATFLLFVRTIYRKGYKTTEGMTILFCTMGGFGVLLWLLWNQLIFRDPLYFAFGPYSAHSQQEILEASGNLATKGDWFLSAKFYLYALAYNSGAFTLAAGIVGGIVLWFNRSIPVRVRYATLALLAPLFFNVIALYLGHSVLYIEGLSGNTWFNIRYGIMMIPSIAIFVGYLADYLKGYRLALVSLLAFVTFFQFSSGDAVTIDDARVGASQKNVTEVSSWLAKNTANEKGFILISAASHDAIIFSSGMHMDKFIHEGTGPYWENAMISPDHWARWIIMRTYSDDDSTYRLLKNQPGFERYEMVETFPFADIYQLRDEYLSELVTEPVFADQNFKYDN